MGFAIGHPLSYCPDCFSGYAQLFSKSVVDARHAQLEWGNALVEKAEFQLATAKKANDKCAEAKALGALAKAEEVKYMAQQDMNRAKADQASAADILITSDKSSSNLSSRNKATNEEQPQASNKAMNSKAVEESQSLRTRPDSSYEPSGGEAARLGGEVDIVSLVPVAAPMPYGRALRYLRILISQAQLEPCAPIPPAAAASYTLRGL